MICLSVSVITKQQKNINNTQSGKISCLMDETVGNKTCSCTGFCENIIILLEPTVSPTAIPSYVPSLIPSNTPSSSTFEPTVIPSVVPTNPSQIPSNFPSSSNPSSNYHYNYNSTLNMKNNLSSTNTNNNTFDNGYYDYNLTFMTSKNDGNKRSSGSDQLWTPDTTFWFIFVVLLLACCFAIGTAILIVLNHKEKERTEKQLSTIYRNKRRHTAQRKRTDTINRTDRLHTDHHTGHRNANYNYNDNYLKVHARSTKNKSPVVAKEGEMVH